MSRTRYIPTSKMFFKRIAWHSFILFCGPLHTATSKEKEIVAFKRTQLRQEIKSLTKEICCSLTHLDTGALPFLASLHKINLFFLSFLCHLQYFFQQLTMITSNLTFYERIISHFGNVISSVK